MGNIDGLSLQLGVIPDASVTVSSFKGPSPPYGSHRYGFFLFRQFEGMYLVNTYRNKQKIISPLAAKINIFSKKFRHDGWLGNFKTSMGTR